MTKLDITKKVISFIVGAGTTKIVSGIVSNNVAPKNVYDTVTIASGSVVIGFMAADATKSYTDRKIDEIADWWKNHVTVTNSAL